MSIRAITCLIAVCDGCSCGSDDTIRHLDEASAAGAAARRGWAEHDGRLLCPPCQPCTECPVNGGPNTEGRLCQRCRDLVCAGCGHTRTEHQHFPDGHHYGIPEHVCSVVGDRYHNCDCPFRHPTQK